MNKLRKLWYNLIGHNLELSLKYRVKYKISDYTWSELSPINITTIIHPREEVDILDLISKGNSLLYEQYKYIGNDISTNFKSISIKRTNKQKI